MTDGMSREQHSAVDTRRGIGRGTGAGVERQERYPKGYRVLAYAVQESIACFL